MSRTIKAPSYATAQGLRFAPGWRSMRDAMRSILGLVAALCAAGVFAFAYQQAVRPGAGWLDAQWLFLVALPYNWTMLRLTGASNFSPEAPREIAGAALFDVVAAFAVGALIEAAARGLWRLVRARA